MKVSDCYVSLDTNNLFLIQTNSQPQTSDTDCRVLSDAIRRYKILNKSDKLFRKCQALDRLVTDLSRP